jgi:hypothetical protein
MSPCGECKQARLTYDPRDFSLLSCMVFGQAEIALWQSEHPAWKVKRWSCSLPLQHG